MKMTLRLVYPFSVVMTMNGAKTSEMVENSEKRLATSIPSTWLKKLLKLHRKNSNDSLMISFIHNESEITT